MHIKKTRPYSCSRKWYEEVYHKALADGSFKETDPTHFHAERDTRCLQHLGVEPDHDILVTGCGGGDNIWVLDKEFKCFKVWGIDWSQPAVDFCAKHFPWAKIVRGDVTRMPYGDDTFDRVLALDITEHLPYREYLIFLHELYRVVKRGGRVAVLPGLTKREEHINMLSVMQIVCQMQAVGYEVSGVQGEQWIIGQKPLVDMWKPK